MTDNNEACMIQTQVISYLSPRLRGTVQAMGIGDIKRLQEIRLRAGRPLAVSLGGKEHFVMQSGMLTAYPDQAVRVTRTEIEETFRAVCEYSVYSYSRELREGYITLKGGARVGIAGTAVYENSALTGMRNVSSLCFRIPRQVKNCAAILAAQTASDDCRGMLIAGIAGSGKTTILRDMCRLLGSNDRISLIDTRGEIAGMLHGMPQYEIGLHTDVFDGFPRSTGAVMALRAMMPEYIVCDEISTCDEAKALLQVHGCGVEIIASAHAGSTAEVMSREALAPLMEAGVFTHIAFLGSRTSPGEIAEVSCIKDIC